MKIISNKFSVPLLEASGLVPSSLIGMGNEIEEIKLISDSDDDNGYLIKGYTSNYLKDYVKNEILQGYKRFKTIGNKLSLLIDYNIVTPVISQKRNDKLLVIKQLPIYDFEKHIMGFYDPEFNKIFLFIDNVSVGGMGSFPDVKIIELIVHELMHYFAGNHKDEYEKMFESFLYTFYYNFFCRYFSLKEIDSSLIKKYLKANFEVEDKLDSQNSAKYLKKLMICLNNIIEYASSQTEEKVYYNIYKNRDKASSILALLFKILLKENENEDSNKLFFISKKWLRPAMGESYMTLFRKYTPEFSNWEQFADELTINTIFYQELLYSSEVLSMWAGASVEHIFNKQMEVSNKNPILKIIDILIKNKGHIND